MASAKFLDAIARMPGCSGQESDADSAYTQVVLEDMEDAVETWVTIPRQRRPRDWDPNITDPVCRMRINLYGHPLAGLYWEKHCQKAIYAAGFEKIKGHECIYVHRKKQLFPSVYVDDFKMAGNSFNLAGMWETLSKRIFLDPPVPLQSNTYLGQDQEPCKVPYKTAEAKHNIFKAFFHSSYQGSRSPTAGSEETAASALREEGRQESTHGEAQTDGSVCAQLEPDELDPSKDMEYLKREVLKYKLQVENIKGYQ